jgi:glycosyltransferase involved in cell wall biosynthesis
MDDDSRVRVSVVIPARDAEATIGRAVAAACGQEIDAVFEVIVVDDGSSDDTGLAAAAAGARVVRNGQPMGPAEARNAGVAAAAAPLIAFTDADCVATPGWLAAGVAALERADLVQGRVEPEPGGQPGPFDHTITVREETGLYETANLFVRREWFDRVGGFRAFIDPARGHFGEDLVFGWAVRRAGGRTAFAADALVYHDVVSRPASAWIRERRRLQLFPAATRAVPELRSRWYLGIFLSRRTAKFDLALACVLAAIAWRRPWPLLLAVPYARATFRTRHWRRRRVLAQNAAHVAGDLVGFASLVAGSVRSRRAVL